MTADQFVALPGSERPPLPAAVPVGPVGPQEPVEVTLITRRAADLPRDTGGVPLRLSRDQLRARHGSDPADHDTVAAVLTGIEPSLTVTASDPGSRRLTVAGPAAALARVFGTDLSVVTSHIPPRLAWRTVGFGSVGEFVGGSTVTHRYRSGGLHVPAELDGIVVAVLGLDSRPQARPQFRFAAPGAQSYTPPQVAGLYDFPDGTDGGGQTVAIIELGGGFAASDLNTYFGSLAIMPPRVSAVGIDGGSNVADQDPQGADAEVLLDIEMTGAVAPGAAQVVYFAPNTDQGFVDAVTTAVHAQPTPVAISISWGSAESSWTAQSITALDDAFADAVALGITVTAAAGDNGSSDGVSDGEPHADFPASSPHVLACGGTSLQASAGEISTETVWNDTATGGGATGGGATGGGVSATFALPSWQASAGVPPGPGGGSGRGVPDVAGDADPQTGYQVLVDGQQTVIGGTSAVAPLWAALVARLAQALGAPLGLVQQALYEGVTAGKPAAGLRDITTGGNGGYTAGPGWDPCTGLGVPEGAALLMRLAASQ